MAEQIDVVNSSELTTNLEEQVDNNLVVVTKENITIDRIDAYDCDTGESASVEAVVTVREQEYIDTEKDLEENNEEQSPPDYFALYQDACENVKQFAEKNLEYEAEINKLTAECAELTEKCSKLTTQCSEITEKFVSLETSFNRASEELKTFKKTGRDFEQY